MARTTFTAMAESTADDWKIISREEQASSRGHAGRVLEHLKLLGGETHGYAVDRLTHSLQSATRAARAGRDEEYVVCALLHDIGDTLAPDDHSALAAVALRPYVSAENHWIVKHHGIFQGYYYFHHLGHDRNLRDRHRDNEFFDATAEFCEQFDQNCFDPVYDAEPLAHFVPMVERVLAQPKPGFGGESQ